MNRLLERTFLVCGVLLTLDLAFFGPGLIIPGAGIEARRLLLMVLLFAATVRRLQFGQPLSRGDLSLLAWIAVLISFWAVLLPTSYGFLRAQSFADAEPWIGLVVLAIWPWSAWPHSSQWMSFRRFFLRVCVILAAMHVLIWALLITGVISPAALSFTAQLVSPKGGNAEGFIRVALVGNGDYRVYWSSSIFLLGGLYFLTAYRSRPAGARWWLQIVLIGFALWTTYIRAFLGAIAIFIGLKLVLRRWPLVGGGRRPHLRVLALWLAGVALVAVAMNPELLHALQLARSVSDIERVEQARALLERFSNYPLLGTGFGSYAAQYVRTEGAPFSYELVFQALLMKLGLVGITVLLCCLHAALRISAPGAVSGGDERRMETWVAFTTGFWFAGATNPMVTNFAGMAVMVILLVDLRQWHGAEETPRLNEPGVAFG